MMIKFPHNMVQVLCTHERMQEKANKKKKLTLMAATTVIGGLDRQTRLTSHFVLF